MSESICLLCKQPKESNSTGSLTQWISICTCNLQSRTEQKISIKICRKCGKRVGKGRSGSLTQYIFRSELCSCDELRDAKRGYGSRSEFKQRDKGVPETGIEAEEYLELQENSFPTDRYKPLAHLGIGATGSVYLARDLLLNKKVAVKILRSFTSKQLISFQREAKATSKLDHIGIVKMLDFGLTKSEAPYMVLEYVFGYSLHEIVSENGPLPWQTVVQIFEEICDVLDYTHSQGIYHRDIQPGNILVTEDSKNKVTPKLIDFGLSKIYQAELDEQNRSEGDFPTLAGTPLYMSPDQGNNRNYDHRSEIYSLGCVMFECLTGEPPFTGESPLEILAQHAENEPPLFSDRLISVSAENYESTESTGRIGSTESYAYEVPELLQQLVYKCLEKDPDMRFQSMLELKEQLGKLADDEEVATNAVSPDIATTDGAASSAVTSGAVLTNAVLSNVAASNLATADDSESGEKLSSQNKASNNILLAAFLIILVVVFFSVRSLLNQGSEPKAKPKTALIIDKSREFFPITKKESTDIFNPTNRRVVANIMLTETELKPLKKCTKAIYIDLSNVIGSDSVTSYISSPYIKTLLLRNTNVKTLEYVSKLKSLEQLDLSSTLVNFEGIERLRQLKNLRELRLRKTPVDDSIVPVLKSLKCLEFFNFEGSRITSKAITDLRQSMPACVFVSSNSIVKVARIEKLIAAEKFEKAILLLENALKTIQDAQGENAVIQAKYLNLLATTFFRAGEVEKAMAAINRSISLSQAYGETYFLESALRIKVDFFRSLNQLKEAYSLRKSEISTVIERYGLSSRLLFLYYRQGENLYRRKMYEEAEGWFLKVLDTEDALEGENVRLISQSDRVYTATALNSLGRIAIEKKQYKKAEEYFLKAIDSWSVGDSASRPKNAIGIADNLVKLAWLRHLSGDSDQAVNYQDRAIQLYEKFKPKKVKGALKKLKKYKKE